MCFVCLFDQLLWNFLVNYHKSTQKPLKIFIIVCLVFLNIEVDDFIEQIQAQGSTCESK